MLWIGKRKDGTSPLEYIILVMLKKKPRHGNEIISELNRLYEGLWEATTGTIYPILGKMKAEKKLITEEEVKSPLGPAKKVYSLTEEGDKLLDKIVRRDAVREAMVMDEYTELLGSIVDMSEYRDVLFKFLDLFTRGKLGGMRQPGEPPQDTVLLERLKNLFRYYIDEIDNLSKTAA